MKNLVLLFLLFTINLNAQIIPFGFVKPWKTVTIGTQTWMAKNLDVVTYRNGDSIPQVTNASVWAALTTGAWCWYNNDSASYATLYGRLYNWFAVNDSRGLAPLGFHIPSDVEWTTLRNTLGGSSLAGGKLKSISLWQSPNTGATNLSGFSGFPSGLINNNGIFSNIQNVGYWWSATEYTIKTSALYRYLNNTTSTLSGGYINKKNGMSGCLVLK